MMPVRAPGLFRRLATAFALLAMLGLGLHEAAHAAAMVTEAGAGSASPGYAQAHAVADHTRADGGQDQHHGAAQHSCHVCGVVLLAPRPTAVVLVRALLPPLAAFVRQPSGFDPDALCRPPRGPVTA